MAESMLEPGVVEAVHAGRSKKALEIRVLDLRGVASFTDYFVILKAKNSRQVQAIADAVTRRLKPLKPRLKHIEGYTAGQWVLMDYLDFVVHIFGPIGHELYALDRLWHDAKELGLPAEVKEEGTA